MLMQPVEPASGRLPKRRTNSPMPSLKKVHDDKPVSLKILADYLSLSPATVSVVLNNVPGRSIPDETRERVRAAARKFNYQPRLFARSLPNHRPSTFGLMLPQLTYT